MICQHLSTYNYGSFLHSNRNAFQIKIIHLPPPSRWSVRKKVLQTFNQMYLGYFVST